MRDTRMAKNYYHVRTLSGDRLVSDADDIHRVDVSIRLRRAIVQNDFVLFRRILKNNPSYLQNPDYSDKSNTSLHTAAEYGCLKIAVWCCPTSTCRMAVTKR
jgi:hypothetical protein